mmetsp:Transcript_4563/g.12722  ORF Transcript_4563/g.12722 Transcript_4563/m.12722 type:complete len:233 (+) Transcript_4563:294-992(+)
MGAKCMLRWVNADTVNKDNPRAVLLALVKVLEGLDGRSHSKWKTLCTALKSKADDSKGTGANDMHVVMFSEMPNRQYLLLRQERQVMEADKSVKGLLDKLGLHALKHVLEFEGSTYIAGDFSVKLGRASTPSKDFKGIVVEIEYMPISNLVIALPILNEFITVLQQAIATHQAELLARGPADERCRGQLEKVTAPYAEYSLPPQFSFLHAAAQYVAVCSALLATPRLAPATT